MQLRDTLSGLGKRDSTQEGHNVSSSTSHKNTVFLSVFMGFKKIISNTLSLKVTKCHLFFLTLTYFLMDNFLSLFLRKPDISLHTWLNTPLISRGNSIQNCLLQIYSFFVLYRSDFTWQTLKTCYTLFLIILNQLLQLDFTKASKKKPWRPAILYS